MLRVALRVAPRERRAPGAPRNFVRSAEPGPAVQGPGAPPAGTRRRRSSSLLHVTGTAWRSPTHGRGRATPSHGAPPRWRRRRQEHAATAAEGPGARNAARGPAGRPLQSRGPRIRGCPAPFRKSIWSRRPVRTARGRGAGLLSQSRGGRDARTRPCPPRDFHFPARENLGAASLSGTGTGAGAGAEAWGAALGAEAELRPGPVPASLHARPEGLGRAPGGRRWSRGPGGPPRRAPADAATSGPARRQKLQSSPRPALGTRAADCGRPAPVSAGRSRETRAEPSGESGVYGRVGTGVSPGLSWSEEPATAGLPLPGAGVPLSRPSRTEGHLDPPRCRELWDWVPAPAFPASP